jgi:TRAP-type C4-dicarboxylate transport system permease small subunit
MMTGTLGIVMWLMMGAMLTGFAGGGIAWLRRRLKRPRTRIRRDRS